MVVPELLPAGGGAPLDLAEEGRVPGQAPAGHQRLQAGEALCQGGDLPRSRQVPVIAQGAPPDFHSLLKSLQMGPAPVELLPDPGMDGELRHGVAAQKGQQGAKLRRVPPADPGLHRDGHLRPGKDIVQEPLQLPQVPEEAGALPFGGDRPRGAAQIQVDLLVAQVGQGVGAPQKVLRAPGQELGDGMESGVLLRGELPEVPLLEVVLLPRGEEGHEILVHPREKAVVDPAEDRSGKALHGGGVTAHGHPSLRGRGHSLYRSSGQAARARASKCRRSSSLWKARRGMRR